LSRAAPNVVLPDAVLVSAIRSGDEQAMAQLYERYSSIVYSVALRVLGDTGAAEDILQEVFMQLWRSPEVFDATRGSLPGWLAVITRNRAIDSLRKRRPETDITDVIVSIEPDLAGGAELSRAFEKIRSALGGMPVPQRSALEMAFFDGLTHTEIAERTGEPLGTIKTRIRAGLLTLRKAFNPGACTNNSQMISRCTRWERYKVRSAELWRSIWKTVRTAGMNLRSCREIWRS
jgi:RNA polymerase sigma-70 factor, ECF subfamily